MCPVSDPVMWTTGRQASGRSDSSCSDEDCVGRDDHAAADQYEPIKRRLALLRLQPPRNPNKPPTPFLIRDILNGRVGKRRRHCEAATPAVIVRPWLETPCSPGSRGGSAGSVSDDIDEYDDDEDDEDEEIEVEEKKPPANQSVSPLDALLKMATKTFDTLKSHEEQQQGRYHTRTSFHNSLICLVDANSRTVQCRYSLTYFVHISVT